MSAMEDTQKTYTLIHKDKETEARVGKLHTTHGVVNTPILCQSARVAP